MPIESSFTQGNLWTWSCKPSSKQGTTCRSRSLAHQLPRSSMMVRCERYRTPLHMAVECSSQRNLSGKVFLVQPANTWRATKMEWTSRKRSSCTTSCDTHRLLLWSVEPRKLLSISGGKSHRLSCFAERPLFVGSLWILSVPQHHWSVVSALIISTTYCRRFWLHQSSYQASLARRQKIRPSFVLQCLTSTIGHCFQS